MTRSAALGGLFIGVLSALPIVSAGNCCCCLWIVSGGALAAFLEQQQKERTLTAGEGAGVGALSGIFGAFIWVPIALLVSLVFGPVLRAVAGELLRGAGEMPPEARQVFENMRSGGSPLGFVLLFFFQLFVGTAFAAIGGMLGAAYFKKETPPAMGGTWVPPLPPQ